MTDFCPTRGAMIKSSKCGKMQFRLINRTKLTHHSIPGEAGECRMLYEDIALKLQVPPVEFEYYFEFDHLEAKREITLDSLQSLYA